MTPIENFCPRLFKDGPPLRMHRLLGIAGKLSPTLVRRALATAIFGWLPVVVLMGLGSILRWDESFASFQSDYAFHARSLIAAPLLVLAEAVSAARLGGIALHFLESGIVPESERERFDDSLASTLRLRDSALAELVVAVLAYVITLAVLPAVKVTPSWWLPGSGPLPSYSPAGWWQILVSFPLLLTLVLGWLWRVALWARFLWLVAHLKLRLIAAHPDLTAGLKFLGYSVRAFSPVALAFAFIVAGPVANAILNRGEAVTRYQHVPLVLVVFVLILFSAPLFVFLATLLDAWRHGVFHYGAIASELGREFEKKWFEERRVNPSALEVQDFSATVDLYQFVSNVYQMRIIPYDLKSLAILVVVTLLPFVPIVLFVVPFDVLLAKVAGFLL